MTTLNPKLREQIERMVNGLKPPVVEQRLEDGTPVTRVTIWDSLALAMNAATLAVEHERSLVCQECGELESSPGCNRHGEHPGNTYGTQPGFITRAEHLSRRESKP